MKRYSEYKDSGVKWIGEIPGHWKISHIKHHSQFINGYAFDSKIFNNNNKGVKVIRIGNIDGTLNYDTCIFASIESNLIRQFKTCKNDILIAMSGATIGKSCKVSEDDEAYINQRVGIIRCQCFSYMHYYIQAPLFRIFIDINNAGCAQPNISSSTIGNMLFPIPPLNEQEAIVTYLDTKVAKIDEYISIAEKKIAALEELKQTIIAEAVTRGIHKEVPMKDSGVKWIGMIPEHWKMSHIKRHSQFINGYAFDSKIFNNNNKGVKVIRIGNIDGTLNYDTCIFASIESNLIRQFKTCKNDILIAMSGATIGKSCKVSEDEEAYINQRVGIIRSQCFSFLHYYIQSPFFQTFIELNNAGCAQPNISSSTIGNIPFCVPPLSEQQEIVTYLDSKVANINQLCQAERSQIEKLKEYKQRLISDVVTGKVKVTND